MFRHCVMFKWNDEATEEAKAAICSGLDALAQLDAIQTYTHGPDARVNDGNWDYVVVGDFATVDDYRIYATDPAHLELISELIRPNIAGRAAIQYNC